MSKREVFILDNKPENRCLIFGLYLNEIKLKRGSDQSFKLDKRVRDEFKKLCPNNEDYFNEQTKHSYNQGYTIIQPYFEFKNLFLKIE